MIVSLSVEHSRFVEVFAKKKINKNRGQFLSVNVAERSGHFERYMCAEFKSNMYK